MLKVMIPNRFRLPLRYYRMWLTGRLDDEISRLAEHITNRERTIDVGANMGIYSYALSKLSRHVEAFEPIWYCTDLLKACAGATIRVHNVALSDHAGEAKLHIPLRECGAEFTELASLDRSGGNALSVPLVRLDDYDFRDVGFIKIDVEGHEMAVLNGGRQTIERNRPGMLIEIEQRHIRCPISEVFDFILGLGYHGIYYLGGKRYPLAEFSYEHHQARYLDNVYTKAYVNNFWFTPI